MFTPWPEGVDIIEKGRWPNRLRYYVCNGIEAPSVTTVLKVLGLSKDPLMKWAADTERQAALEVCGRLHEEMTKKGERLGAENFAMLAEKRMGEGRKHVRDLNKAGEIGTQIHRLVEQHIARMLGEDPGDPIPVSEQATWAFMAWEDWLKSSGLKPVRREQPVVWAGANGCPEYAGTLDSIWEHPKRGLGLLDLKSSRGIYLEQHLQVWAYVKAARQHADIQWGQIVRVPKKVDDPEFEVRDLGHDKPYGGGEVFRTEADLDRAFSGACNAFHVLMGE